MGVTLSVHAVACRQAIRVPGGIVVGELAGCDGVDGFGQYAPGFVGAHTGYKHLGCDAPLLRFQGMAAERG